MVFASAIVKLHDELTGAWHVLPGEGGRLGCVGENGNPDDPWLALVARHHRANFDLWHIEDEARTPGASDATLADVKRRIDRLNQVRNDLAEAMDRTAFAWLVEQNLPASSAALHSESPGLMIDRLSILALKIYHTREEAERTDGPAGHAGRNRDRLVILEEQRGDLAGCLDALWCETMAGLRRFKVYQQMKMYNDPSLNPAVYGAQRTKTNR